MLDTPATSLSEQLITFLQEEGLQPEPLSSSLREDAPPSPLHDEPSQTLRMPMRGKNGEWLCLIRVFEHTERIVVYSILPRLAEPAQRIRAALLLTRINYGLVLGNFEMDLDDGEMRYKTSIDIEGSALNRTVVRNLVYGNFLSMDLYYHALVRTLDTEIDIERLVHEAEHPNEQSGFDLVDEVIH